MSKVCVLYVGGTIGMVDGPRGLEPRTGYVERYLASVTELSAPDLPEFDLIPMEPLIDSAQMTPADWVRVAEAVVARGQDYAGFVILHGTDTMVYTASALSYLLQSLSKPIIFTGAQLPLQDPRSDGREHIVTALILAGTLDVPEVCIYFGDRLLRGNRCQKVDNNDFVAYNSGNYPPLATVGVRIEVERHRLLTPGLGAMRMVRLVRKPTVISFRVFPGLTGPLLRSVLAAPVEGVVLETYGAGTFPITTPGLLDAVAEAVARGGVVVNCSQCHSGRVHQDLYSTSRPLGEVGVVSGHDMTPEAALTKLYCLLGAGYSPEEARRRMGEDLAGEVTV